MKPDLAVSVPCFPTSVRVSVYVSPSCVCAQLPRDTTHLKQRPCYQQEVRAKIQQAIGPQEDPLTMVKRRKLQWYVHVSRSSGLAKNHLARHSEKGKKTRQTEEEVGRQHQEMDRPGVRYVPEGSGEQGKIEKTGCKIICGAPTTLAVKGLMMMMMMKRKQSCGSDLHNTFSASLPR